MKRKVITIVCALAIGGMGMNSALAQDEGTDIAVDALIVRPVTFVSVILGCVIFVVALPVTAPSKSVHKTADALVVKPAKVTFTRPMGDFDALQDPSD